MRLRESDSQPTTLSLAAGLALIEAIDVALPGLPLMLKWPNDLLLSGKKVAGILLERSGDRIVVGFGVNLAQAPPLPDRPSAALPREIKPEVFAPLLAGSFARLLNLWRNSEGPPLIHAWEHRAHLYGTKLSVHSNKDENVIGRFGGLEPDGALRLLREDGSMEVIRAADVFLG